MGMFLSKYLFCNVKWPVSYKIKLPVLQNKVGCVLQNKVACVLQSKVACILQYKVSSVLQCKLACVLHRKVAFVLQGPGVLRPQLSPNVPVPFWFCWDKGREGGDIWGQMVTFGDIKS